MGISEADGVSMHLHSTFSYQNMSLVWHQIDPPGELKLVNICQGFLCYAVHGALNRCWAVLMPFQGNANVCYSFGRQQHSCILPVRANIPLT